MDNLTHTLTGLVLARAGLDRSTPGATLCLAVASNLPDIDIVATLKGPAAYLQHHRDVSHSVVGAPLLALGLASALRFAVRGARLRALAGLALLGVAVHVFMDLWTSYGTRVLAPVDRTWYTWDLVFIVDPWLILLLAATLAAPKQLPRARIAALGLGLVATYVGGRAVLHARALDEARHRVPSANVERLAALPTPVDPLRWRVLADTGDAYLTGDLSLRGSSPLLARRPKRPEDAVTARARETSGVARTFLDFATFPWLQVVETPDGTAVSWTDLRFERGNRETFVARVVVDAGGRIRSESLRF
jgi:inner membrane protein